MLFEKLKKTFENACVDVAKTPDMSYCIYYVTNASHSDVPMHGALHTPKTCFAFSRIYQCGTVRLNILAPYIRALYSA